MGTVKKLIITNCLYVYGKYSVAIKLRNVVSWGGFEHFPTIYLYSSFINNHNIHYFHNAKYKVLSTFPLFIWIIHRELIQNFTERSEIMSSICDIFGSLQKSWNIFKVQISFYLFQLSRPTNCWFTRFLVTRCDLTLSHC